MCGTLDTVKLYFLDEGKEIASPEKFQIEYRSGEQWKTIEEAKVSHQAGGHRPSTVTFAEMDIRRLRFAFTHAKDAFTGLTEIETWGTGKLPYVPAPPKHGNLAYSPTGQRISPSHRLVS